MRSSFSRYIYCIIFCYVEILILACTIYILTPIYLCNTIEKIECLLPDMYLTFGVDYAWIIHQEFNKNVLQKQKVYLPTA